MSLNWKEIERTVVCIRDNLLGGMIQKISSADELSYADCLFFSGYSGGRGSWGFSVAMQHQVAGILYTDKLKRPKASKTPNGFVQFLRKYIQNKPIRGVEQIEGERVVIISFVDNLHLVLELMPRKANMFVIELEALKDFSKSRILCAYRKSQEYEGTAYEKPAASNFDVKSVRDFDEASFESYWRRSSEILWESLLSGAIGQERRSYLSVVDAAMKKTRKTIQKFESELKKAASKSEIKEYADVLSANLYEVGPKAMPQSELQEFPHFDDGRLVKIKLDKRYSFSENANRMYEKIKKLNRTEREATERLQAVNEDYSRYEGLRSLVNKANSQNELKSLDAQFVALGLKKATSKKGSAKKRNKQTAKPFLEIKSSDGFSHLIGRTKEENRRVTFQNSVGSDTWLHVKGAPGAHCIIKNQRSKSVPLSTLLEASQMVAYYSKVKPGAKVEIDYTLKKFVRSQKGTIAEVTYTENKTLYIEADSKIVRELMKQNQV